MNHIDDKLLVAGQLQTSDFHIAAEKGVTDIINTNVVATLTEQTHDPQALMEQADKCLYAAKRLGRNQVVRWDQMPEDVAVEVTESSRWHEGADDGTPDSIPFQVVTGLFSALAYRDMETAEHSRRVAVSMSR